MNNFHFAGRERPVRPGASVGLIDGEAGTATALVKRTDVKDGSVYLLSCEHVLKPKNFAGAAQVVQPAMQDAPGTGRFNRIGTTIKAAGLSEHKTNLIDAAIVRLFPEIAGQNFTTNNGWPIFAIDNTIDETTEVTLIGRSSGVLEGEISTLAIEKEFDYQSKGWKKFLQFAAITKCIYKSAPKPGDSGAPVINMKTGNLIGLHIAGGIDQEEQPCGFFCAIWRVFETLNIELI